MGLVDYLEKKAHQTWLKRAMDISWTCANGIGMVFGPLTLVLQEASKSSDIVAAIEELIDHWLIDWQNLQNQSARILGESRDDYGIRSHAVLSSMMSRFQRELEAIRSDPHLDGPAMLAKVMALNSETARDFTFRFNEWLESEGAQIGFNPAKYQDKAVRKAHKSWEPTVRQMNLFAARIIAEAEGEPQP